MAWQTPKTNWSAADGVRDSDFNRIEGNILELYNKQELRAATTFYVNAISGDDTTGTGSVSAPFKTIMKAVNSLPKHLGGYNASISIASGTYEETVNINGFAGKLMLTGVSNASVNIYKLVVDSCVVIINSIVINAEANDAPIDVENGGTLICTAQNLKANNTTTGTSGVKVGNASSLFIANTLTVGGMGGGAAVLCTQGSVAHIHTLAGSNKASGLEASNGGKISFVLNSFNATSAAVTYTGGRIYSASQASIPNY